MGNARQRWRPRVQPWQHSGLTAGQFAAQHGLKPASLRYWECIRKRSVPHDPSPTASPCGVRLLRYESRVRTAGREVRDSTFGLVELKA